MKIVQKLIKKINMKQQIMKVQPLKKLMINKKDKKRSLLKIET